MLLPMLSVMDVTILIRRFTLTVKNIQDWTCNILMALQTTTMDGSMKHHNVCMARYGHEYVELVRTEEEDFTFRG